MNDSPERSAAVLLAAAQRDLEIARNATDLSKREHAEWVVLMERAEGLARRLAAASIAASDPTTHVHTAVARACAAVDAMLADDAERAQRARDDVLRSLREG